MVDSTAMDAAVLNLVDRMAEVGKEVEDSYRGVLEDVLFIIMLSVDLEEVGERMELGGGAGGGGGYSGGASGNNDNGSCGGGGGSYNAGKKKVSEQGKNGNGHGYVEIKRAA